MKISLVLFLSIIFVIDSYSQIYKNVFLDYNAPQGSSNVRSLYQINDKFVIPVLIFDSDGSSTTEILEIDSNFSITTKIKLDSNSIAPKGVIENDKTLYFLGKNRNVLDELSHSSISSETWNIEFDTTFSTSTDFNFPTNLCSDSNYQYLFFIEDNASNNTRTEAIIKSDFGGNQIWKKRFNAFLRRSFLFEALYDDINNFYISSRISLFDEFGVYSQLKKIDLEGNQIWEIVGEEELVMGGAVYMALLSNGEILQTVEVNKDGDSEFISNNWDREPTKFIWYSSQGELLNEQYITFPRKDEMHIYDIKAGKGDYFFAFGEYQEDDNDLYFGLISKYDNDGTLIWSHKYQMPDYQGVNTFHQIFDLIEHEDGNLTSLGLILPQQEASKIWMMHLNSLGCLGSIDCQENVITELKETSIQTSDLRLYPNPVADKLSIETDIDFKHFEIFNSKGQLQIHSKYKSNINVNFLNAGLYYIRLTTADGSTVARSFYIK